MTKSARFAALLLVCSSSFVAACSSETVAAEAKGSTTSHETKSTCREVYQGRSAVASASLSGAGAQTNAFAIPVDQNTTSHIQLTFHAETTTGVPWSEFTVRVTDSQGRQLGNVVTSGGGLQIVPLLTSAYPTSNVFYAQVTLANATEGIAEQVTLASDVWVREGCEVANEPANAGRCSCDGVAVDGNAVHSDVCGQTVCGTDHKLWVCGTDNYQPSSDPSDCE